MAILRTCCCFKSVRSGSFACGIYSMIFYTIVIAIGAFHIDPAIENKVLLSLGLIAVLLSGMCVMTSALLLVGLCVDNRTLLIPWLLSIATTTVVDLCLSFYFISDWVEEPSLVFLFVIDIFVCGINAYCFLCVTSQYQEYLAGRGRPEDCFRVESPLQPRALKFHWPSFQVLSNSPFRETVTNVDQSKSQLTLSVPNPTTVTTKALLSTAPLSHSSSSKEVSSTTRLISVTQTNETSSTLDSSPPSTRSVEIE